MNEELEQLVDSLGLYGVIEKLETICYEKSEHLESNWQDPVAAKNWQSAAKLLGSTVAKLHKIQLP